MTIKEKIETIVHEMYGGSGVENSMLVRAENVPWHGQPYSGISLPAKSRSIGSADRMHGNRRLFGGTTTKISRDELV